MPLGVTTKQIKRTALNTIHNPPKATDKIKVSHDFQKEKTKMVRELIPFLTYLYKKYMGAQIQEGTDLEMLKLINKAMKLMPGSPKQKKVIQQLNKLRKSAGMEPLKEDIKIPIKVGDTVLGGKFKNKRIVVKSIGKNDKGDITINGKPLLKYRLLDEGLILEGNGDCYQAAVNVLMRNMDKGTLVHGMVNGQGRLEGIRFGHAWVEIGNKVLDYSNGNKVTMPKKAYYALGRVNPNECKYYKYKKAAQFMLNRGHYGPWEMSGDTVMAEDIPDSKGEIGKKKVKVSKDIMNSLDEGVWSKSALDKFNRKPMPGRYFISDEKGNILEKGLKTRRSWVTYLHRFGKASYGYLGGQKPKVVNIHDGKKNNEVVDQYYWRDKYGKGNYSIDIDDPTAGSFSKIDPKLVNYKEIEKQLGLKNESNLDEACWKGYKQVGGKKKNGKMVPNCVPINEIPMGDLEKIDTFADKKLNPVDVVITDKHFFDRLNDPRNGKEISSAELIGFFKRLSKKKKEFVDFLEKYKSVVAVDDRTNINIPFMKKANKAIAKTIMRKKDFKTPNQKIEI